MLYNWDHGTNSFVIELLTKSPDPPSGASGLLPCWETVMAYGLRFKRA